MTQEEERPPGRRHGHGWGEGWAQPRKRPPWWPESEAWPPARPEAWRAMQRRFVRRMAGFAATALVVFALLIVGIAWLVGTLLDQQLVGSLLPAIGILIAVLLALRILRGFNRTAAPLGDLVEASARVEAGEVGTQVEVRGVAEVRTLARAFNAMSTRLAETDEGRRRLLADVSHELRTPLTVIQGNVEAMIDGLYPADREALERILAETRRMERLIEDLRTLSMADAGALALRREPMDLGVLAADVAAAFAPQALTAEVLLAADPMVDLPDLELDPLRVRQAIGNLVSNAIRHTPKGGRVTLSVAIEPDGTQVVAVADSGMGMDADAAAHAFDRFWRSADSPGAGLGLAIARDLVTAHGGTMELASAPGRGTIVRCRFPPTLEPA